MVNALSRLACLCALMTCCAWGGVVGQHKPAEGEKPTPASAEEKPAKPGENPQPVPRKGEQGYDRPTEYPRMKFGGNADGTVRKPDGSDRKVQTRAYLIDVSDAMTASINVEMRETTRFDLMVDAMSKSLDTTLALYRGDRFNIVTFGSVSDLAGGKEPFTVDADSIQKAKDWLRKLEAKGGGDIYALLKAVFDQAPNSAALLVGSMPAKPAGLSTDELSGYADINEFVLAKVKAWRAAGKGTTLDVTGVGLDKAGREFYDKLAKAAGGVYTDA